MLEKKQKQKTDPLCDLGVFVSQLFVRILNPYCKFLNNNKRSLEYLDDSAK